MAKKKYTLHRCGDQIQIEKESDYFTAILPGRHLIHEVSRMQEVEGVKRVFRDIYKMKSNDGNSEDLINHLRAKHSAEAVFHHSYNPVGDDITRYYITDQLVVRFEKGISNSGIEKIMATHGLRLVKEFDRSTNTYLFQVTSSAGKNPVKLSGDLMERKEITFAEPNLVNRFDHAYAPVDDLYTEQWHLNAKDGIELVKDADVSAPAAWDITRGKRSVVVAVIDDGFDLYHPDLSGEGKIVFPKDFIDGDSRPFPARANSDYHGTPCAGVAIGEDNGNGIIGIAPRCGFLPIRFSLSADDNLLWEIFDYAGRYADVLSCSWGPVPVYAPNSSLLNNKFTQLAKNGGPRAKGCVIVFAGGNFNAPLKDLSNSDFKWRHPSYGIRSTKTAILNGNCVHEDVIAVAASTSQNRKAAYSNWGKEVSVCAPSSNWHPLDPAAYVPGRGIWTTDNENFGLGYDQDSRYTNQFGGTSSATPLVAGIAALCISANPDLTAKEVKEILEKSTDKIEDKLPDPGLNQKKGTYKQGHSEWFGYGKVNAAKAVKMAVDKIKKEEAPVKPKKTTKKTSAVSSMKNSLFITAALVNPKGREAGNEFITIFNASDKAVDLGGWMLTNASKRKHLLNALTIGAGDSLKVRMNSKLRLSNRGTTLMLLDADGALVHSVTYKAQDAKREGWSVVFK